MLYQISKLNNGLTFILVDLGSYNICTGMVLIKTGSIFENINNNGISHFLEHLVFKGTQKYPNSKILSKELESNGFIYNAFTSNEYTGYYLTGIKSKADKITEILSDMYYHPLFNQEDIEKEKGVIVAEINMNRDQIEHKLTKNLYELLFPEDSLIGMKNITGEEKTVEKLTSKDFIEYHNKYYTPNNSILILSGNLSELNTSKIPILFDKKVNNNKIIPNFLVPKVIRKDKIIKFKKDMNQSQVMIGFLTFGRENYVQYLQMSLLLTVLTGGFSSKLIRLLRDKYGYSYFVTSNQVIFENIGLIAIHFNCTTNYTNQAIDLVKKEIFNLKISKEEFNIAKNFLIGNVNIELQTTFDYAINYGLQFLLMNKIVSIEEINKYINEITIEDLMELKNKYLVKDNLYISIANQ